MERISIGKGGGEKDGGRGGCWSKVYFLSRVKETMMFNLSPK